MTIHRRFVGRTALAAAATLALSVAAFPAAADGPDNSARSGAWWQWALSIPAAVNPMLDATGQNCMVGQSGKTWFLAGTFNGGTATRRCSIPPGVRLFFPVANSVQIDSPGVCAQEGSVSIADLRAFAAAFIDGITTYAVTLDSRPVRSVRRVRSDVFAVAIPAANVFNTVGCETTSVPVPAAVFTRSIDDGYYAEIEDLSAGTHTLHITASGPKLDLNVVYQLDVAPRGNR